MKNPELVHPIKVAIADDPCPIPCWCEKLLYLLKKT